MKAFLHCKCSPFHSLLFQCSHSLQPYSWETWTVGRVPLIKSKFVSCSELDHYNSCYRMSLRDFALLEELDGLTPAKSILGSDLHDSPSLSQAWKHKNKQIKIIMWHCSSFMLCWNTLRQVYHYWPQGNCFAPGVVNYFQVRQNQIASTFLELIKMIVPASEVYQSNTTVWFTMVTSQPVASALLEEDVESTN